MAQVVVKILATDMTGPAMKTADTKIKKLTASAKAMGSSLQRLMMLAGGSAIYATKKFSDFDKRVAEIVTLLDQQGPEVFKRIRKEIEDMAVRFGQSVETMAKARYQIVSAGFRDIAESADIAEQSAKLAVAGVATVSDTADVMTSVLNAYKDANLSARDAADTLFTTVKLGKTTVPELAHSMGRLIAVSSMAGVSFDEVAVSLATLTQAGQQTEEGVTAIRRMIISFIGTSKKMSAEVARLGYESAEAFVKEKGLAEALNELADSADMTEIRELFLNIRALQAAAPLAGNMAKQLADNMDHMANRAGANQKAFEIMEERISFRLAQINQKFQLVVRNFGEQVTLLIGWFLDLDESTQNIIVTVGLLAVAFKALGGPLTVIIGVLYLLYRAWTTNFYNIQGYTKAAIASIVGEWERLKIEIEWIADVFDSVINNLIIPIFELFTDFIKNKWKDDFLYIRSIIEWVVKAISDSFNWLVTAITDANEWIDNLLTGIASTIKSVFEDIYNFVDKYIKPIVDWIADALNMGGEDKGIGISADDIFDRGELETAGDIWSNFWDDVTRRTDKANEDITNNVAETAENVSTELSRGIAEGVTTKLGALLPPISELIFKGTGAPESVAEEAAEQVSPIINAIGKKFEEGFNYTSERIREIMFDPYVQIGDAVVETNVNAANESIRKLTAINARFRNRELVRWTQFQAQIGQNFINLVGDYVAQKVGEKMREMTGQLKGFFGELFASILQMFVEMIAKMTAKWLAFKALTALSPGLAAWLFFSRGGKVPVTAQSGLRVGTDTVPALLTPGEAVISRENTRKNLPAITQMMGGQKPSGGTGNQITINPSFNITAIDADSVRDLVRRGDFIDEFISLINDRMINLKAGDVAIRGAF